MLREREMALAGSHVDSDTSDWLQAHDEAYVHDDAVDNESVVNDLTGDSHLPTAFALVYVVGLRGDLEDADNLAAIFSSFGTVQGTHVKQERRSKKIWALVTFADVPPAQAAIDAAPKLSAQYPGLVSSA